MSMGQGLAPVILFAFERPDHTSRVLSALRANPQAPLTDLIAYVDGPRTPHQVEKVNEVRRLLESSAGFRSVTVHASPTNLGLANSIVNGVTSVIERHGSAIIVEDDIEVSPYFLEYMNAALNLYEFDESVASIHAYLYPVGRELPSTFFIQGSNCWGWATWSRAWVHFNPDGRQLLGQISDSQRQRFDFGGNARYTRMLKDQIAGRNDSWAVRWYASTFVRGMLTLYPGHSLAQNIGLDGSGHHAGSSQRLSAQMAQQPVSLERIALTESPVGRTALNEYFRSVRTFEGTPWPRRMLLRTAQPVWRAIPFTWRRTLISRMPRSVASRLR